MTIEPIGSAGVALYITAGDLNERGLAVEELTLEEILPMVRQAFEEAEITIDGAMEIEAYPNVCGVLVFARVKPGEAAWYSFDGLEEMLGAIRLMDRPLPGGMLGIWEGRYWLRVEGDLRTRCLLSEFGRQEEPGPYFEARLAEHGTLLIGENAFERLTQYFGLNT